MRAITDATGAKVESAIYRPFGEQSEGLQPGTPAPETKGWIGERFDADAGLQYLNARYYDPALGMFLQPDWFEVTKPGVGTNRFSYSFNDPVNKIDPGGNDSTKKALAKRTLRELIKAQIKASREAFELAKTQYISRNAARANTTRNGIRFDADGFPDFSDHLYKGKNKYGESVAEVEIDYTGNRRLDKDAANKAAGLDATPEGYVWHHHQDYGKMQLVEEGAHAAAGHTGGFAFAEAARKAEGNYSEAIRAVEKVLNSRTMAVIDMFDPMTYYDLMHEAATGYSIWDTDEDIFMKCVAAGKCT